MKLAPFLSLDTIEENLEAADAREVLVALSSLLVKAGRVPEGTDLVTILENREELGSTAIGNGIAIPHVRIRNVSTCGIAFGRSAGGVDFNAHDGLPVHIFILIIAPDASPGEHLKVLAHISRLLKKPRVHAGLLEARGREEIERIIVSEDEKD